ncbi:MAG: aminotransferase class V-fold PLP-dependent enzyme [Bacteroidetes bacterium]|nr:aminotransferase class V-fold PLP-dependent enzyme [Bacteroidota bacterium]
MPDRRHFLRTAALSVAATGWTPHLDVLAAPTLGLPTGSDDWAQVRARYDLWAERTYLNTGGLGPAPRPVLDRFRAVTDDLQLRSETGHRLIEEARPVVARFFGAAEREIMFTRNATEGNAIVASGMHLEAGDEVVIDSHAHPGGAIPWLNRWKQDGVVVRVFDPSGTDADGILERIARQMTPRTRIIQVSHVTAPTGILMPVDRIAGLTREAGCWFHIDGAQSAGMLPIDLRAIGCDSWATSGHKWLGAPHGTGVLFLRANRLDDIRPTEVGAYSDAGYALPDRFDYIDSARRHESGTRNAPLVAGLEMACRFMDGIGMDRVRERGLELTSRLRTGLQAFDRIEILTPEEDDLHGSILTFRPRDMDFRAFHEALSTPFKLRIRIVTEADLNAVRISLHVFNSETDADRVIEAVRTALI